MEYICNCTPTQGYPHLVRTPSIKRIGITLPNPLDKNKRFLLGSIITNLSPGKSCDNHPIPFKNYELNIGKLCIKFGKIVY